MRWLGCAHIKVFLSGLFNSSPSLFINGNYYFLFSVFSLKFELNYLLRMSIKIRKLMFQPINLKIITNKS